MYRFKTREEFLVEFGDNWAERVEYSWNPDMDIFFGLPLSHFTDKDFNKTKDREVFVAQGWSISRDMLVPINEVTVDRDTSKMLLSMLKEITDGQKES